MFPVTASRITVSGRDTRRIGRRAVDVVSALVLLTALVLLVPGLFGMHRYVITGGSMSGAFEPGAVVFARDVPVHELRVGDVITYQPPADSGVPNLVTHRVSDIEADADGELLFTTKGDANAEADPWRFRIDAPTQPKVVLAVDHLGWPLIWLADRAQRMVLIGAPAAMIFLFAARELVAGARRSREPGQDRAEVVPAL